MNIWRVSTGPDRCHTGVFRWLIFFGNRLEKALPFQ